MAKTLIFLHYCAAGRSELQQGPGVISAQHFDFSFFARPVRRRLPNEAFPQSFSLSPRPMVLLSSAQWRTASLSVLLAVGAHLAPAQGTPAKGYDFLTVTAIESGTKSLARLMITPAFQGKTEVQLEAPGGLSFDKNLAKIARNTELVNQQLTELTAAGWELVQVYQFTYSPDFPTTRYLFRKAKN